VLASAHATLLAHADNVSPDWRVRYLSDVPEHRNIMTEWASQEQDPGKLRSMEIQR
jgi:hypothetical protein